MEVECGLVVIRLIPETSPNSVKRFKLLTERVYIIIQLFTKL